MIHLLFVLGVVLSRARRWHVFDAQSSYRYAQRAWACLSCPALFSGLLLTLLMAVLVSTVGGVTLIGWAAIIATQLRWRGNRRVLTAVFNDHNPSQR